MPWNISFFFWHGIKFCIMMYQFLHFTIQGTFICVCTCFFLLLLALWSSYVCLFNSSFVHVSFLLSWRSFFYFFYLLLPKIFSNFHSSCWFSCDAKFLSFTYRALLDLPCSSICVQCQLFVIFAIVLLMASNCACH